VAQHQGAERLGVALGVLGLRDDGGASREARGHHAQHRRQEERRADPVREHLELGSRRGARIRGGAPLPGPPGEPWRDGRDHDEIAEGGQEDRRDQVDAGGDRREEVEDEPVDQRDGDEGRPHPCPAQTPADTGGPKALVSIHWCGE
jgi:hypothetical protein